MKKTFLASAVVLNALVATSVRSENPEHVQRLLETKECPGCDLKGANLSGANLNFAILVDADLRGANLKRANLSNADLTRANLSQADFSQANLNQAYLTNANLDRTTLIGASLNSTKGLPIINGLPLLTTAQSYYIRVAPLPRYSREQTVYTPIPPRIPQVPPRLDPIPPPPAVTAPRLPQPINSQVLFNTNPQVAEAREYFSKRWRPPSDLRQNLEYSLLLNVDGSIQRIIPLGQAAREYLAQTGMPLIGEPFVSRNARQTTKIRLVLLPNGTVQVLLEPE